MKPKHPKKWETILKILVITSFVIYTSWTSKIEKVNSLDAKFDTSITQNIKPYNTIEEINLNLEYTQNKIIQAGLNGLNIEYNGIEIEIQKYQPQIIEVGQKFIDTFIGSITGYGPDCKGCSGQVAAGLDVENGNIYYNDSKYGKLRIIAADKKYPYGSIFRISNSKYLSEPTLAIVMDRGSAIKGNKIDLLFESEKSVPGAITQKNVTIDVVRLGW